MNGSDKYLQRFVKSRDKAFIAFVMNDDWDAILNHLKKFGQYARLPKNENIAKAGIYKAVQECTNIPDDVKAEAARKCALLGFRPTMF